MYKKSIITYLIGALIISALFGYSLVFGAGAFFGGEIKVSFKLSNNVYTDSLYLKNTKVAFKSNTDISKFKLSSKCDIFGEFISKEENIYFFNLKFFNNKCYDNYVYLKDLEGNNVSTLKFNIISEYKLYSSFIDYNTQKLQGVYNSLEKKKNTLSVYGQKFDKKIHISYYNYLINNRVLNELLYNMNVLKQILDSRKEKYLIPVENKSLSQNPSKLPNSSRNYRSDYTDGIHHGWDFDGNFGEQVISIDDGIIIRVVSGFNFSELNKIIRGNNISDFDKTKNLDVLRGNQVWVKTSKGDVAFYSHLNDIYSNIKEGQVIRKGQPIGTIGITGVPDKNYTDYHLHLPVHKNPYNSEMAGKYDYDDYMKWDWYFKNDSLETILKEQGNIFE